nr:AI-2E family transporter [PVC group bacterium]
MNQSVKKENPQIIVMLLSVLAVVAVCTVLKVAQSVILPLMIAWLLSYVLAPVVTTMTDRKIPTGVAVTIVLILVLGVCYLAAGFLHARIVKFVQAYPKYHDQLMELLDPILSRFNVSMVNGEGQEGINWGDQLKEMVLKMSGPMTEFLLKISGSMFVFLSKLLIVIIFLVFLLLGKPFFKYKVQKAFSKIRSERITRILNSISGDIGRYMFLQLLISLFTGFMVWLALTILRVDFAVTWGALAFFLNFIPNIGSIIASIPPILVAIVQFYPSVWHPVLTAFLLFLIQMVIGNGLSPKIMGDRLNLSPLVVLLSLVFWGWLWGIVGALLSVPIASAIKIVCDNINALNP